ncbi:hypothetical protein ANCDUO_15257, partial [Ancylostoma duodenale]
MGLYNTREICPKVEKPAYQHYEAKGEKTIVSDSSAEGKRKDLSGPAIVQLIENSTKLRDAKVVATVTVPDERALIEAILVERSGDSDVIITTGGTGFAPRDVTPE